jgi:hypothetical protein
MMKKTIKIAGVLAGIALLDVIGFYTYLHFMVFEDPFNNKKFERAAWIENHDNMDPDNPRGEMYQYLLENKQKKE